MYSGITSGRVLDGELLYTKIVEVNLFAFAYRLFHRDFSPINGTYCAIESLCKKNIYIYKRSILLVSILWDKYSCCYTDIASYKKVTCSYMSRLQETAMLSGTLKLG